MHTSTSSALKTTPMMAQWHRCKEQASDAFLFFRLGDFYEAFHDDACRLAEILDLTLTKRQDVPMCGIPWHSSESYIDKLISMGHSVALAEQTENGTSKLMERKVVRIITPSTSLNPATTPPQTHCLFICIAKQGSHLAASIIDVSSSLFEGFVETDDKAFCQEIIKRKPKELLVSLGFAHTHQSLLDEIKTMTGASISKAPHWMFDDATASKTIKLHFNVLSLDGIGLTSEPTLIQAVGAHLFYLKNTLLFPTDALTSFRVSQRTECMHIDRSTMDNLELFESSSASKTAKSLFDVLNTTFTPMGSRKLRTRHLFPFIQKNAIEAQQKAVASCIDFINKSNISEAESHFKGIKDLERTILRIHSGAFSPRDVASLGSSLAHIEPLQTLFSSIKNDYCQKFISLPSCSDIQGVITKTLQETPPLRISDGHLIRQGVSPELDELRALKQDSNSWLLAYQNRLKEEIGIKTLKVGFTRAFGYYIEVSRSLADKMPTSFVRRQTLAGQERFISEELKAFEEKVLSAEARIASLEASLFSELVAHVLSYRGAIVSLAQSIGDIDLLFAFARKAVSQGYCCPTITDQSLIDIRKGRHPVLEESPSCAHFTPNDLLIDSSGPSLLFVTGPNMGGKSTYIRQAAILVIMAQMGSYIPAESATIGIVDKVFSRIGASDDLARGQSTFMVEMAETAHILRAATPRSLILLDEIGRGTSTFDGIAIAQSVAEFLLTSSTMNPKTLFATHYFELTALEEHYAQKIKNMTVAVCDGIEGIEFLHQVIEGKADKSYGIHVASLAGMPKEVIARAKILLHKLEKNKNELTNIQHTDHQHGESSSQDFLFPITSQKPPMQYNQAETCLAFIKKLDLIKTSPLDCFIKLIKFKEKL